MKSKKIGLKIQDFFLEKEELAKKKVLEMSEINLDLSFLKKRLMDQFNYLEKIVLKTDASFLGAVSAQKKKQLKHKNIRMSNTAERKTLQENTNTKWVILSV